MRTIDNLKLPNGQYFCYRTIMEIPSIGLRGINLLVKEKNKKAIASAFDGDEDWVLIAKPYIVRGLVPSAEIKGEAFLSKSKRCPHCLSIKLRKGGFSNAKRRWRCKSCNRITQSPWQPH